MIGDITSDDEYLEIPAISRQKAGTYECTAVNDIDADTQTVDITVNCECAHHDSGEDTSSFQKLSSSLRRAPHQAASCLYLQVEII